MEKLFQIGVLKKNGEKPWNNLFLIISSKLVLMLSLY